MPEGWEKKKIEHVAVVNQSSLNNSFDGEIEYVDIASVTTGQINETTAYEFRDAPSRARRIVKHGDIIWSCVRPNRKSHAIIWKPLENLIVSTGFAVLTPLTVPTSYLYYFTTTDEFVGYLHNRAGGVAYPAVKSSDFEDANILIPPETLLKEFNEFVTPIIDQMHELRSMNYKLRQARDILLPKLMSGEIEIESF
jgi:type I restriction enzyme S subunit